MWRICSRRRLAVACALARLDGQLIEVAAQAIGDLDDEVTGRGGPRRRLAAERRKCALEPVREIHHHVEADGAGRALQRVRDPHHLVERLGGRAHRAAGQHARRHRLERIVCLGAEQLAQHRQLVGIEVEVGIAHGLRAHGLERGADELDRATHRRSGSSKVSGRPVVSTTAPLVPSPRPGRVAT